MKKCIFALLLGTIAAIIDVIPMIIQGLDAYACTSAFLHWIGLGVIITYFQADLRGWLKGLLVAEIAALPIIVIVMKSEPLSIIPIVVMSAVLGSAVGFFSGKYAG